MARKSEAAAIAHVPDEPNHLAEVLDFDFEFTGLEGADGSDIKTPLVLFNLKGQDENGRLRQLNEYLITDTDTYATELRVVFVAFTKSHAFKLFDETKNKSDLICVSYDRQVGTLRKAHPNSSLKLVEGTERKCAGCPDNQWFKDDKNKNRKNCAEVVNVFASLLKDDLTLDREFLIRFTKTSLPGFMAHLNKHHFKKHPTVRGKDVPLFAYEVVMRLEVDKGGIFARPTFTLGRTLPRETIRQLADVCKGFHEAREDYIRKIETDEAKHGDSDAVETTGEDLRGDDFADS